MGAVQRCRERRLLRRIRAGDTRAANRLIDQHYEWLYRWLLHLCQDPERASDLTQETFAKVWQGRHGFQSRSSLRTWMHCIAYNTYVSDGRRRAADAGTLPDTLASPPPDDVVLQRCAMSEALAQLPPIHRHVIILHYTQGFTCAEVGDILGVPRSTVLSRLHAARIKLREALGEGSHMKGEERNAEAAASR